MLRFLLPFLAVLHFSSVSQAQAEARDFLTSCAYGVLAGALVGAATLAVEDNPDEKLHRIARGASLGLYTGIALGLYVVYWLPNQGPSGSSAEEGQLQQYEGGDEYDEGEGEGDEEDRYDYDPLDEYEESEDVELDNYGKLLPPPRMIVYPIIENQRITGAAVNVSVFRF